MLSGTYCAWECPPTKHPTTSHVWKTRGCQCSFRLLMIGSVSPETYWASYKYGIIKFWYIVASSWIFLYKLKRQCFKTLQMFSQYCHFLISLEYEMQESSWNLSLDIRSHCSLGSWVNFIGMFTYLNVCILRSMGTLLVTRHWRMGPQTSSQHAVPLLWGDEQGDTRLHSDKNMEIDSVTGTIVYME